MVCAGFGASPRAPVINGGVYVRMDRRSFLKAAGLTAATGGYAAARTLILLDTDAPALIGKIEWIVYETGLRSPSSDPEHRCVVRITTTTGVQGWSDMPGWTRPDSDTVAQIRNALLQQEVSRRDAIWRELYEQGLSLGTLAGVDIALWDLLGRLENKPVHALLGTRRQTVKTYLTSGFNLGDPQKYAEYALACKEAGIHGCKIHPYIEWGTGRNGVLNAGFHDRDMAVYRAVRDAVGPDYPCMADNYCTYTYEEALRVGRLLDDLGYEWYESPMPESDAWRDRYVALAGQLRTPVCAPETHPESYPARVAWITAKACDISRIDVLLGGFTPCLELALACEAAGVPLDLHHPGRDAYPHLQLIGATSESLIKYTELVSLSREPCVPPGRATPDPVFDAGGYVPIPQTPGMGVEMDWPFIYAHRAS